MLHSGISDHHTATFSKNIPRHERRVLHKSVRDYSSLDTTRRSADLVARLGDLPRSLLEDQERFTVLEWTNSNISVITVSGLRLTATPHSSLASMRPGLTALGLRGRCGHGGRKRSGRSGDGESRVWRSTASCISMPEQHSTNRSARLSQPTTMNSYRYFGLKDPVPWFERSSDGQIQPAIDHLHQTHRPYVTTLLRSSQRRSKRSETALLR